MADAVEETLQRCVLMLGRGHSEAWANLGNGDMFANRPDDAVRAYDRSLKIEPRFGGTLINRGTVLQRVGRYHESADSFERAAQLDPTADFVWATGFSRGVQLATGAILREAPPGFARV